MIHYYFTIKNNTVPRKFNNKWFAYITNDKAREDLIEMKSNIWNDKSVDLIVELSPDYSEQSEDLKKTIGILGSSFENGFAFIPYVENLIKEVEEVIEGKRETIGWNCEMADVDVYKEKTLVTDVFAKFQGELPTSEIYELLKDWLEFLKEYFKRSFVPLEWIKPEFLDKAIELQKPINGSGKENQEEIVYRLSDGKSGSISDLVNQIEKELTSKSYTITQIELSSILDRKLEGIYISAIDGFEHDYIPEKSNGHLLILEGRVVLIITEGNFGQLKSGNFGFGKYLLKTEPYQTENSKTGEKYEWLGLKMEKDGKNVWEYGGEFFAIAKKIKVFEISGIQKVGEEKTVANLFVYKQNNATIVGKEQLEKAWE